MNMQLFSEITTNRFRCAIINYVLILSDSDIFLDYEAYIC